MREVFRKWYTGSNPIVINSFAAASVLIKLRKL